MNLKNASSLLKISVFSLITCALMAVAQAEPSKADGTWTWTMQGRNGGPERKLTLTLKTEGKKLAGKLTSPGRDGQTNETEIKDGKIEGDEISFSVTREWNGNKVTSQYKGKVTANSIKGKIEFERDGEKQSRDWEAKREAAKK